jgi:hypothetical protein
MAVEKQLLNFIIDQDLLQRIDDFRFERRFPTRAGAIKWLLDWALRQAPKPEVAAPMEVPKATEKPPAQTTKVGVGMSHESAIQALKDQGYEVGETGMPQNGQMRIVVRSSDRSALVTVGQELQELAAGRVTLAEIAARRSAG